MTNEGPIEEISANSEATTEPTSENPKPKRVKTGGRQKGSSTTAKRWQARDIADKYKFHGLAELIQIYQSGRLPIIEGQTIAQTASPAQRLRALEQAALYRWPRLSAQEISGPDGGPIQSQHAELNMHQIMASPELVAMAQKLSLHLSGYGNDGSRLQIEGGTRDEDQ